MKNNNSRGIYLHIPFCRNKCSYCDFYSLSTNENCVNDNDFGLFYNGLQKEISHQKRNFSGKIETIYLGGGTPGLLNIAQLEKCMSLLKDNFQIDEAKEITIEVNPFTMTEKNKFEAIIDLGFNRISAGIQTLNPEYLKKIGRNQNIDDALRCMEISTEFKNVKKSFDVIYGLPDQNIDEIIEDLKEILKFKPDHISCYELSISHTAPIYEKYLSREFKFLSEERKGELTENIQSFLMENSYTPYEISNFSTSEDTRSIHNSNYWKHVPYLGLGPSAHSLNIENKIYKRWHNPADLEKYAMFYNSENNYRENIEILSAEEIIFESIFLGLRTIDGIDLNRLENEFSWDIMADNSEFIENCINDKKLILENNFLKPTLKGLLIADGLSINFEIRTTN